MVAVSTAVSVGAPDVLYPRLYIGGTANASAQVLLTDGTAVQGAGVTFLWRAPDQTQVEIAGIWDAAGLTWRCAREVDTSGTWAVRMRCTTPQRQTDWMLFEVVDSPNADEAPGASLWLTQTGQPVVTTNGGLLSAVRVADLPAAGSLDRAVKLVGVAGSTDPQVNAPTVGQVADFATTSATAAVSEQVAGKADQTALLAVEDVAAAALPKAGGTMEGALALHSDPDDSATLTAATAQYARAKASDAAHRVPVYPTLTGLIAQHDLTVTGNADFPAVVTAFRTENYSVVGAAGGAYYIVDPNQTSGTNPSRYKVGSRYFIQQTKIIDPRMWGARTDVDPATLSDTTAADAIYAANAASLDAMVAYYQFMAPGNTYDQVPAVNLPVVVVPPGYLRTKTFKSIKLDRVGTVLRGDGANCCLVNVGVEFAAYRGKILNFSLIGGSKAAGTFGIKLTDSSRRDVAIRGVDIRDREIGFWNYEGSQTTVVQLKCEKNRVNILCHGAGDTNFIGTVLRGPDHANVILAGNSNEMRFIGGEFEDGGVTEGQPNMLIISDKRLFSVESYFNSFANTNATRRSIAIEGIVDAGDGRAKIVAHTPVAVSGMALSDAAMSYFWRGDEWWNGAQAMFSLTGGTGGTVATVTANGVELLGGAVTTTSSLRTSAAAVVTAINARTATTGFRAVSSSGDIYVFADRSYGTTANGWTLTWTLTGSVFASGQRFTTITTSSAHGLSAAEQIEYVGAASAYLGTERPAFFPSATQIVVEGDLTGVTALTQVTRALFAYKGGIDIGITGSSVSGYNFSSGAVLDCGPGWLICSNYDASTTAIAYAGAQTGASLRVPGWDLEYRTYNYSRSANDFYWDGVNINTALIDGFNVKFNCRLKTLPWVRKHPVAIKNPSLIQKMGDLRGRSNNPYGDVLFVGNDQGWSGVGAMNPAGDTLPGDDIQAVYAPDATGGMSGYKASRVNKLGIGGSGVVGTVAGQSIAWAGADLASLTKLSTWLQSPPFANSDEEAASLTPAVGYHEPYWLKDGSAQRMRMTADPATGASFKIDALADTYTKAGTSVSFSDVWSLTRGSVATVLDATGAVVDTAANVRRISRSAADLAVEGFLLERAAAQLIANPNAVGAVAGSPGTAPTDWTVQANTSGISRTINGIVTEDGVECLSVTYSGTATAAFTLAIAPTSTYAAVVASEVVTGSVYLKLVSGILPATSVRLQEFNSSGTYVSESTNTVTPTAGAPLHLNRYSVARTMSASAASCRPRIGMSIVSGTSYSFTVLIGGWQTDHGRMSSLVRPAAGTSTARDRAFDMLTLNAAQLASLRNLWQGTAVVEFNLPNWTTTQPAGVIFQMDDGTNDNRLVVYRPAGASTVVAAVVVGGVLVATGTAGTLTAGTTARIAFRWRRGVVGLSMNGGAVQTLSATWAGQPTNLRIGNGALGTMALDGLLRSAALYPYTLSDAELQAISVVGAST